MRSARDSQCIVSSSDLIVVVEDVLVQVDLKAELAGAQGEALGDQRAGLLGLAVHRGVLDLWTTVETCVMAGTAAQCWKFRARLSSRYSRTRFSIIVVSKCDLFVSHIACFSEILIHNRPSLSLTANLGLRPAYLADDHGDGGALVRLLFVIVSHVALHLIGDTKWLALWRAKH